MLYSLLKEVFTIVNTYDFLSQEEKRGRNLAKKEQKEELTYIKAIFGRLFTYGTEKNFLKYFLGDR